MPTPDPNQVRMLNPPPISKPIEEKYNNKIFIYLTDTLKGKYEQLKGDDSWSQVGRKALKVYFEGAHTLQMPNIEEYLREIVALVTHRPLPISQPRNLDEEAKWNLARKQAVARTEIQKIEHVNFQKDVIPLLEEALEKDNYGLETVPFEVQMQQHSKTDRSDYLEFHRNAQLNKKQFDNCKWKQQAEEVVV